MQIVQNLDTIESKIDIVYTWVNGADSKYISQCQNYTDKVKDINPERFRDIYQMLKYSIRSMEMYIPWINNIYIVTQRPQIPEWLNQTHARVKVVHHDEIFEKEDHLPTFNPNTIESYLHNIPGLSDHFLYVNDDFLFGQPVAKENFISKDGIINVFGTLLGENLSFRIFDGKNDFIGLGLVEHCPLYIDKQCWMEMMELYPEKMEETRSHRFRQKSDLMTYKLYRYFMLKYKRNRCRPVKLKELNRMHMFHKITNNLSYQKKSIAKLKVMKPNFYCLNDDQKDNPNMDVVELVQSYLQETYPNPSSFEKQ